MSDQEPTPPHEVFHEEPSTNLEAYKQKPSLYQRVTKSVPLMVTIIVHLVLFLIAGALVVQQQIVGQKKKFEAGNPTESTAPQVEHRLQVARKGGSSGGSSSPVSANRIYSTAEGALQLPDMPSLPSMGAGGFGGFGGMSAGIGLGAGTSMNTSLGGGGLGGRGFMSLSFLGMTSQNVSKLVFIVDVNKGTMQEGRGGFEAFAVIREEIMRLIAGMPPGAQFNVILYEEDARMNLFNAELVPASVANKDAFMQWMTPVNSALNKLGIGSAGGRVGWRPKPLPENSGIDDTFDPVHWVKVVRAALEMQPDTVFVITSSRGRPTNSIGETEWMRREREYKERRENWIKTVERMGLDPAKASAARNAAYGKARREFDAANRAIVAKGRPPIIIGGNNDIFGSAVQARLKREGFTITLDKTGWSDRNGNTMPYGPSPPNRISTADWGDQITHMARLQRALLPERAALNIFFFAGTATPRDSDVKDLSDIAKRNGGRFEVLTNQRLKELKAQAAEQR
ncbi:MAG: hypothetical protein ABII82_19955 [Verrucomicrobiota bacterium]